MLPEKKALLLDMNSTFMFGEDRFGDSEDFSKYYRKLGGRLPTKQINNIVRATYSYLDRLYPDEKYRHDFPSLKQAIDRVAESELNTDELDKIIGTFAFHELGHIPDEYVDALKQLQQHFILAAVIDIWSPKTAWLHTFEKAGISGLFSAMSFSSDHGMVKPSPKPFQLVLDKIGITNTEAVVIGDSPRRDLGGAINAGIDCILVGGAKHADALCSFDNLLELTNFLMKKNIVNVS